MPARGGQPPSVNATADLILGPLYYRALFLGEPADATWARGLVSTLLP